MVILTQTDTTVGFLSQNQEKLTHIKSRPSTKPFIRVYKDFTSLDKRVPRSKRRLIRHSKKTTFIVNEVAFRIAKPKLHATLLENTSWFYSTSANESSKSYERTFCESKTDIIIEDKNGLYEENASKLLKINKKKIRRLR